MNKLLSGDEARMYWIAVHEAGHAVAHFRLHDGNRDHGYLSIQPSGDIAGLASQETEWIFNPESMQKEVTILCCGYAACVAAGLDPTQAKEGCDNDFEKVDAILGNFKLDPFSIQLAAATTLMSKSENLRAVQRLADELVRHQILRSEEVDVLIEVADGAMSEEDLAQFRINLDTALGAR